MKNTLKAIIAASMLALGGKAEAITFPNGYDSARYDITSPTFFLKDYDFSGVGKNGRWVTAISDQWGVTATHYPAGGAVTFQTNEGPKIGVIDYVTSNSTLSGQDISLCHFSNVLDDAIKRYPIVQVDKGYPGIPYSYDCYMFQGIFDFAYVGKTFSAGIVNNLYPNSLDYVDNMGWYWFGSGLNYVPETLWATPWYTLENYDICKTQTGDSGGPSFLLYGGEMYLAGTHKSYWVDAPLIGYGNEIIKFAPDVQLINLRDITAEPILPEPTSLMLLTVGASALTLRRRKETT